MIELLKKLKKLFRIKPRETLLRILYYDGSYEWVTKTEWERRKKESREVTKHLKDSTPFTPFVALYPNDPQAMSVAVWDID